MTNRGLAVLWTHVGVRWGVVGCVVVGLDAVCPPISKDASCMASTMRKCFGLLRMLAPNWKVNIKEITGESNSVLFIDRSSQLESIGWKLSQIPVPTQGADSIYIAVTFGSNLGAKLHTLSKQTDCCLSYTEKAKPAEPIAIFNGHQHPMLSNSNARAAASGLGAIWQLVPINIKFCEE